MPKLTLDVTHPLLAREWHPTLNGPLLPSDVTHGQQLIVSWQCVEGHVWEKKIKDRVSGAKPHTKGKGGCPYCCNQKLWVGFNDLQTVDPKLASEWDTEKNELSPSGVIFGSHIEAWWKCAEGHLWQAWLNTRYHQRTGCSVCSGLTVIPGLNDFPATFPELLQFVLGQQSMTGIHPKSKKRLAFTCSCGCGFMKEVPIGSYTKRSGFICPETKKVSNLERKIERILLDKNLSYSQSNRILVQSANNWPIEIDFVVYDERGEKSLGIEVQDFTTHALCSDTDLLDPGYLGFVKRRYPEDRAKWLKKGPVNHEMKRKLALEQHKLKLIDIWEDEIKLGYAWNIIATALNAQ